MKLVKIPDEHHVVRHCKRRLAIREGDAICGVYPEFFHLRQNLADGKDETYLSAFYYEFFEGDAAQKIKCCADSLPYKMTPGSAMIVLAADAVREQGRAHSVALRVSHETTHKLIPSKARIDGVPLSPNTELSLALSGAAISRIVPYEEITS